MSLARPSPRRSATTPRPRTKTRERILDVCRELFNARGPASVTTAEIARSLGINEGNLYYHFKRKEDVLEALFDRFSDELLRTAVVPQEDQAAVERYRAYLTGWFRIMWEWRFFYRDGAAVFRLAPALRSRLREVSDEGLLLTRKAVVDMERGGLIAIPEERIDRTIVNAWIIATYWIDHLRSRHGIEEPTREQIDEGAAQIMSLFAPYLTEAGRELSAPHA
ncbi:TetR/AcrR family transcriptional regulator [Fulvimarina endophytica]|uniref:TetR/AcrR family transcriptional regulator n=1 Tax=Fulvimarina endophytica TaxID=2293836 RepID=A0A371X9X2_9HYPH|nr:TetR/AcrR family transcriptional regulator [Fulvimarina endophytica]RFC66019.1 TetR/AcrR family transcriptional regulator [Fulvimarina endophytica]